LGLQTAVVLSLQVGQEGQHDPFLLIHWSSPQLGLAHNTVLQKSIGWQAGQQLRSAAVGVVPWGHVPQVNPAMLGQVGLSSQLGQQSPSWNTNL